MNINAHDNEMYLSYVFSCLHRIARIGREDFEALLPYLELHSFDKKTVILQEGALENYISIVGKGLVKKYCRANKNEIILQLATEGHIVQSEISFHYRTPSEMIIETIEPTVLVSMHYDNVQKVLKEMPRAEELALMIITYMLIKKDNRYYLQLKTSTRERFLSYVSQHPHMLQRVPQKILASYLNIKPETFSRLKHLV